MNDLVLTWEEWENHVLTFFQYVLLELRKEEKLPRIEASKSDDSLNRVLAKLIAKEIVKWQKLNPNCPTFYVEPNGRINPSPQNKKFHPSENKEPEFKIPYRDYSIDSDIVYTIECKCLEHPPSKSCPYYVEGGIKRYIDSDFSYGIYTKSGLMIGYVQDGIFEKYHDSINHNCKKHSIPPISLIGSWQEKGVSRLEHTLNRPSDFPPTIFELRHFWIDLRDKY